METGAFVQGNLFDERTMTTRVPAADTSTGRSKGPDGVDAGRMYDYVVACEGSRSKLAKVEAIEDHGSRPHELVKLEVRYKKEPQAVRIPECLRTCARWQWRENTFSGGQCARCWQCDEKKETQRRAEVGFETWKIANTAREGIQVPKSQTARDGTQVPVRRSHFDEEEYQGHEEDIVNILEEDRQQMCG